MYYRLDGEVVNSKKIKVEYQFENRYRDRSKEKKQFNQNKDKNRGCYFCGDMKHWANDCPYSNGIRVSEGRCFGCGTKTHTI